MSPDRFRRLEEVFQRALDLGEEGRDALLDSECSGDSELRAEVERLIAAWEQPPTLFAAGEIGRSEQRRLAGRRVGPYRLLAEIGRGGMSVVFLAERADGAYRSRVAVKMLRILGGAEELVGRFERERQILAGLDHPNIVRLFDGGTTDEGWPYLVMGHVDGVPIDAFCGERSLGIGSRLRLFLEVCSAVAFAHRRLVVHLDLKPANILITREGVPKLLDFGIAKLIEEEDTERADQAMRGGLRPLTPGYASPEQIAGGAISTASDVYSLGVVLHLLLFEVLPDEPAAGVGRRTCDPDLAAVVGRCLAEAAGDRYPSVESLADDVLRWLEHRPVAARSPSAWQRLRKLVRRNRLASGLACGLAAALIVSAVGGVGMSIRLQRERDRAREAAAKAERTADFVEGIFDLADPAVEPGNELSAEELLTRGAERARRELADQPRVQASVLGRIGAAFLSLGLLPRARPTLAEAAEILRAELGPEHAETAAAVAALGETVLEQGELAEADRLLAGAIRSQRRAPAPDTAALARSLELLARVRWRQGRLEEAERTLEEVLTLRGGPSAEADPLGSARVMRLLGNVVQAQGRRERAVELYDAAMSLYRQHLDPGHPELLANRKSLAWALLESGDLKRAEVLYREVLAGERAALPADHPRIAFTLNHLASLLHRRGDLQAARELAVEGLAMRERVLGGEHLAVAVSRTTLGAIEADLGELERAEALLQSALATARRSVPPESPDLAHILLPLGDLYRRRARCDLARPLYAEALSLRRSAFPEPGHPLVDEAGRAVETCSSPGASP